jgi:hypothetical protein
MAMKKSIGRTFAHIDVAANTLVRIHEDFFNTHGIYRHLFGIDFPDGKATRWGFLWTAWFESETSESKWEAGS